MYQQIAAAAKETLGNLQSALTTDAYDYTSEGANQADAVAAGMAKAEGVGKVFGPLGGFIGALIGKAKALKTARTVFGNREQKAGLVEEYAADQSIADQRLSQLMEEQKQRVQGVREFKGMELNLS